MNASEILIWLFIINLGTAFGAGLYETIIILPQWFQYSPVTGYRVNPTAMKEIDTGRKFWAFVTTIPLTILTILNLFYGWNSERALHHWWITATSIVLVERIATFFFFIPMAIKLQSSDGSPSPDIHRLISTWKTLNHFRCGLTITGWILAIRTLALLI